MRLALPLILFAATLSLALGMVLPLIRVERFFVFADEPSLIGMIQGLWQEGDWGLSLIIALFSVVFPCLKLGLCT
jgi:paraquat-inducible protein A